jgi:hypothetical protein
MRPYNLTMPVLIWSDMVGTMLVAGSYLEIKALKVELRIVEK